MRAGRDLRWRVDRSASRWIRIARIAKADAIELRTRICFARPQSSAHRSAQKTLVNPMKIHVDRLSETPTTQVFEAPPSWWSDAQPPSPTTDDVVPQEDFRCACEIHMMGADIYIEGKLTGAFELSCARCLARYRQPVQESFRLVLEPAGSRVPPDADAAEALARDGVCLGEELEVGWFRGQEIDLGPYFLEVIALALPVKPLCREDCLGLCPRCGVDRNVEKCHCNEVNPASPFAALQTLKGKLKQGEN